MIELKTFAEKQAEAATKLPAFNNVALLGLKEQVSEMLSMIGRVKEIFSTYTKHDISHVEEMLKHLDWVIPPSTQKFMTPTDWLLLTLSIYFHDLGMIVTSKEFENRNNNPAYTNFLKFIETDQKGKDYFIRSKKMGKEEREKFFFQEFIRENHATRIKEWITGRNSWRSEKEIKPISEKVSKLLDSLPTRFREHLAIVCESHHLNNLNRLDLYPLCQRYGNEKFEMANVQYVAIILRTVDLIHITKDRTPSIMFKTISFSDLKGVEEWEKQRGVFVVRHAGREFDLKDENTHVITVSADFTEERPFFSLTEYISWADTEIKLSKRWNDQSREQKDSKEYIFPWQSIIGDLRVEGNQPQQMRFEFDRGKLLDLLVGHAIYNDPTVAIRELIQNGIDAVRFQYLLDKKNEVNKGKTNVKLGKIIVYWDANTRKLIIEDNGTGMDWDIIKFHLMRVGSSFYATPQFLNEYKSFTPISRFGIGILTCLRSSDDIEIVTVKGSNGHRIRMSSVHADYLLRELPLGDSLLKDIEPHGTRVTLTLRESVELSQKSIEEILRYWIILPECQVEYIETGNSPVKIGFNNPKEALKYYYDIIIKDSKNPTQYQDIEYVNSTFQIEDGNYDMVVAVKSGWFSQKSFANCPPLPLPHICIEGIRVSNELPGFIDSSNNIPVLLSVRGVSGLRTTVSRSGLEADDKYYNLGGIIVEFLLNYVKDEIIRISNEKGKPLSRASSVGKWLISDINNSIRLKPVKNKFNELKQKISYFVIEEIDDSNKDSKVERKLISSEVLQKQNTLWTIESRLVDSLGIISRDLGRELSLNEFILSLAPEHKDLGHTPIIPDAHQFISDIYTSHHPDLVQFSKLYQQTAIRWVSGFTESFANIVNTSVDEKFDLAYRNELKSLQHFHDFETDFIRVDRPFIYIAEVIGDEKNIFIIKSRMITILRKDTELASIWNLILTIFKSSFYKKDAHSCALLTMFVAVFDICICRNESTFYSYTLRERFRSQNEKNAIWKEFSVKVNKVLEKYKIEGSIPESYELFSKSKIFNASDYWRDWFRKDRS